MRSDSHLDKLFRKTRFNLYSPQINEENVRRLYGLKLKKGRPMTKLINQILNEYFERHNSQNASEEGGEAPCTNVKSAETHSRSNAPSRENTTMTSATGTAHSAAPNTTP